MSHPNADEPGGREEMGEAELGAQKDTILRQILDPQARMRLNNIKMVKPDLVAMLESYLINMASQGKIGTRISDEQLKQILLSMRQPKRDFRINRV